MEATIEVKLNEWSKWESCGEFSFCKECTGVGCMVQRQKIDVSNGKATIALQLRCIDCGREKESSSELSAEAFKDITGVELAPPPKTDKERIAELEAALRQIANYYDDDSLGNGFDDAINYLINLARTALGIKE